MEYTKAVKEITQIGKNVIEYSPEFKKIAEEHVYSWIHYNDSSYWKMVGEECIKYREGKSLGFLEEEALTLLEKISFEFFWLESSMGISQKAMDNLTKESQKFLNLSKVIKKEAHFETDIIKYIREHILDLEKLDLGKRDKQTQIILLLIKYFEYDKHQIPFEGKGKIREICEKLTEFTDSSFDHTWGDASESKILKSLKRKKKQPQQFQ
jgi:hypothetical protein